MVIEGCLTSLETVLGMSFNSKFESTFTEIELIDREIPRQLIEKQQSELTFGWFSMTFNLKSKRAMTSPSITIDTIVMHDIVHLTHTSWI
jgi:hypothetical protein